MDRTRQQLVGIDKLNPVGNVEIAFIAEELDACTGGDKTVERQYFVETEARAGPERAHLLALRRRQVRIHGVSGPERLSLLIAQASTAVLVGSDASKSNACDEDCPFCLGTRRRHGPYHDAVPPRQTLKTYRSPACRGGEEPRRGRGAFRTRRRDRAGATLAKRVDDASPDREKLVEHDGRCFVYRWACRQARAQPAVGRMGPSLYADTARSCYR